MSEPAFISNYVHGARVERSTTGSTQPVTNPATGEVTGLVNLSTAVEVGKAVDAAAAAFPAWRDTPPLRRARVMFRFLQLLEQHKDSLARAITSEHGKVFSDAQGEVARNVATSGFQLTCGLLAAGPRVNSRRVVGEFGMLVHLWRGAGLDRLYTAAQRAGSWRIPILRGCRPSPSSVGSWLFTTRLARSYTAP